MKRFSAIFMLAFSRKGFAAFTVYYAIFFMSILNVFPDQVMQGLASLVNPYYGAIRMIGIVANIIICFMVFRFLIRFIQYEPYAIKRKGLSFIMALCFVQLLSFFCYTNLPAESITITAQLGKLQAIYLGYGFYFLEIVALCVGGYLVAFYVGALSHSKFAMDVILAPKRPQK